MHRTNIYLDERQCIELDERARALGISRAELIRRLIDAALIGEDQRLASDLEAIRSSFGVLADDEVDTGRADGDRAGYLDRLARS